MGQLSRHESSGKRHFFNALLDETEALALITHNPVNRNVLFPFLNGDDVNSRSDQSPSRWVINFFDWPLDQAELYFDCMKIVRERVKPERDKLGTKSDSSAKGYAKFWWQFGRKAQDLYSTIVGMQRVLAIPLVSSHFTCAWQSTSTVFSHALGIVATQRDTDFAVIQSTFHDRWAREHGSTLETRMRYTPTDCFETFPFPESTADLDTIGQQYYAHRQAIMQARQEGLTKTYNRFHNTAEAADDIVRLRVLHVAMDQAVAAAYGWTDLDLGHGFHPTKQGLRYTISEAARRTVLDRLLALNHARYAAEVAAGLHDKGAKGQRGKGKAGGKADAGASAAQGTLFGE